jgi:hypothetical protein
VQVLAGEHQPAVEVQVVDILVVAARGFVLRGGGRRLVTCPLTVAGDVGAAQRELGDRQVDGDFALRGERGFEVAAVEILSRGNGEDRAVAEAALQAGGLKLIIGQSLR